MAGCLHDGYRLPTATMRPRPSWRDSSARCQQRRRGRSQRLRRRTTAAQRGAAAGRRRPPARQHPRHRLRDGADHPPGRTLGPGGERARGRCLRARDRTRPRARPGRRPQQRHLRAGRRTGPRLSAGALRSGTEQVRDDVLRRSRRGVRQHQAGATPGGPPGDDGLAGPRTQRVGHRHPPGPRSSRRTSGRYPRPTGSVLARRAIDRDGNPAGSGVRRRRLHRRPRTGLLRSGRSRRPRLDPCLHVHPRSIEEAGSRRRDARGRAPARGARRAPGRRRCSGSTPAPGSSRHSPRRASPSNSFDVSSWACLRVTQPHRRPSCSCSRTSCAGAC